MDPSYVPASTASSVMALVGEIDRVSNLPHALSCSVRPYCQGLFASQVVWFASTFDWAKIVFIAPFGDAFSNFTAGLVRKTEMDT